jgi:hypothetical protein
MQDPVDARLVTRSWHIAVPPTMRCRFLSFLIDVVEHIPEQLVLDFTYHINAGTSQDSNQAH